MLSTGRRRDADGTPLRHLRHASEDSATRANADSARMTGHPKQRQFAGTSVNAPRDAKQDNGQRKGSVAGDIVGTRKRCSGMIGKLLTDARETSSWI